MAFPVKHLEIAGKAIGRDCHGAPTPKVLSSAHAVVRPAVEDYVVGPEPYATPDQMRRRMERELDHRRVGVRAR